MKEATAETRRKTNPLYNGRKLKLGTFSTNLEGGCAITSIEGTLKAEWPSTLTLARLADEMEFEALVPVGRWRGFGGVTNFNGPGFEAFSWAAGSARPQNIPAFSPHRMCPRSIPLWPRNKPRPLTTSRAGVSR